MSVIEILAVAASLGGVLLSVSKNSFAWGCNIIASGLYAFIFFTSGLYSDMELQGFFILMALYGWWNWNRLTPDWTPEKSTHVQLCWGLVGAFLFGIGSGFVHTLYFPTVSFPYLDATLTGMSVFATWLAIQKKIENWLVWIGVDMMYVGMYFQKGLWPTAVLYVIFCLLALKGYLDWLKELK
jgi:nicotinamide mononucleotide transporter